MLLLPSICYGTDQDSLLQDSLLHMLPVSVPWVVQVTAGVMRPIRCELHICL